jgi:hypothetical protein
VVQALSLVGSGSSFKSKTVKTPHRRRTLYLSPDVVTLLREHGAHQAKVKAIMGDGWAGCGLVFTTMNGISIRGTHWIRSSAYSMA